MPLNKRVHADDEIIALAHNVCTLAKELAARLDGHPATEPEIADSIAKRCDPPLDGRWAGCMPNGAYGLDLRLDREISARLSGEFFRAGPQGFEWLCSFGTCAAERVVHGASSWTIAFNNGEHMIGEGSLSIAWISTEEILVTMLLSRPPAGLPADTSLFIPMRREGTALRRLRLRTVAGSSEQEATDCLRTVNSEVAEILSGTGFEVTSDSRRLPAARMNAERGWGQAEILSATLLSEPVAGTASQDLTFELVIARKATRADLLSFVFEPGPALNRPVIVVHPSAGVDPHFPLQQVLRQFGNACGLLHRGHPRVARAHSYSPMNDPEKHPDGESSFWSKFTGEFDPDEVSYLRHTGLAALRRGIFGHEAPYWTVRQLQPPPPSFLRDGPPFRLELVLPAAGPLIELGQPLFLTVRLVNTASVVQTVDISLLDLKCDALVVKVLRSNWSRVQPEARSFRPIIRRQKLPILQELPPGGYTEANLQLGFGRDGPLFSEPGTYEISAHLDLPTDNGALRVEAKPLQLRARDPSTRAADRDALALLDDRVGLFLALGGLRAMPVVAERLAEIATERSARGEADGVAATIWRALAIDEGRAYPGLKALERENRIVAALDLLGRFDDTLLAFFDGITSADLMHLKRRQIKRMKHLRGNSPSAKSRNHRTSTKRTSGQR